MEYSNKKAFIDNIIKGFTLFFVFVIFLFLLLGEKYARNEYVYRLYNGIEENYIIFTFMFSYAEMLTLFYLRDKNIRNKTTHIISLAYSFLINFVLFLLINHGYLKLSSFIWLLITIELTYTTLIYKENDIKKALLKEISFWGNKKSKRSDKNENDNITDIIKNEILNGQLNPDTIKIINKRRKMFRHPFSFKGRIRCLEYVISFFIFTLYSTFFLGLEPIVWLYSIVFSIPKSIGWFIFSLPALWFIAAQGAKRCHDAGNSGWCQLIPFWTLFLLFEEGDAETNKYGPNPKEKIKIQKDE